MSAGDPARKWEKGLSIVSCRRQQWRITSGVKEMPAHFTHHNHEGASDSNNAHTFTRQREQLTATMTCPRDAIIMPIEASMGKVACWFVMEVPTVTLKETEDAP